METTFPIFAGIIASMLHVISGPDHLAAVTPLVIEAKKKAWKIGLFWGFGHISGMLLIGVLFLIFKEYIPINKISEHSEQLVGIVLIGIGIWSFYRIFRRRKKHKHPHIHSEEKPYIHIHTHGHKDKSHHHHSHNKKVSQNIFSSFGIGLLHGLAGIAHFLLFLPVLGFESKSDGLQYVLGFGIGTILAMTAYAFALGKLSNISKQQHDEVFFKGIRLAGGSFAIIIGIYWLLTS